MTDCSVFPNSLMRENRVSGISIRFRMLSRSYGQVTYVLLTRPPLSLKEASSLSTPLDLHVLGTPPAFVLSQDQTLHESLSCSCISLLSMLTDGAATLMAVLTRCSVFKDQFFFRVTSNLSRRQEIIYHECLTNCNPFLKLFYIVFNLPLFSHL